MSQIASISTSAIRQGIPNEYLRPILPSSGHLANAVIFFWNKSQATAANVYLLLYPKGELKRTLAANPNLYPTLFSHLQSLTGEHLINEGRVYGGGLHQMEPKHLANLPADAIAQLLERRPPAKQMHLAI